MVSSHAENGIVVGIAIAERLHHSNTWEMDVSNLHFSTISNFLPFIKVCLKLIDRESSSPRKFVTSTHVSCRATFFGYSGTTSRRAGNLPPDYGWPRDTILVSRYHHPSTSSAILPINISFCTESQCSTKRWWQCKISEETKCPEASWLARQILSLSTRTEM